MLRKEGFETETAIDGESAVAIALKQVSEAPIPPSQFNAAVTPELEYVVLTAMAKDPAARYQDADQFIAALEQARANLEAAYSQQYVAVAPDPYPADEEEGKRRWWLWALIAAAVVAAILAAVLLLSCGKQTEVPDVVGQPVATAEKTLESKGFSTDRVLKSSSKAKGTVIAQDPEGGVKADDGSTVKLTVSSGPAIAVVPAVDGQGQNAARTALTDAKFKVKTVQRASETVPSKHVIKTDPEGGTKAPVGSTVTMYVSTGKETGTVPNVVGQSVSDATTILKNAGFTTTTTTQVTSSVSAGTVISQDPVGQATAPVGSEVMLTVAKAPTTVTVPNVVGQSESDATNTLEGAGFQVDTTDQDVDTPSQDGEVLSQSPSGKSQAKKGSTVTLTIGVFVPPTTPTTPSGGANPG